MRSGPLISSVAAVVYITFFSPFTCSNWFLQCSCSPTHVLKQEARGGSCSVGVSCSVFLKHLTDTKALIRRSKHTIWYTEVQLRVHIAYNRKTLSAPMVTGLLAHRWHLSSFFFVNNFLMGMRAILEQVLATPLHEVLFSRLPCRGRLRALPPGCPEKK